MRKIVLLGMITTTFFMAAANASSVKKSVSTKINNVTWVVKGMCEIKAAKGFHAGEEGNLCGFTKSGWVECRTKAGIVIDYMPEFTKTSDVTAILELTEYRGGTGAPDTSIELQRCSGKAKK